MKILIKVQDIVKSFDDNRVIDGISFEVKEGESIAVVGFSGCGKSTVLKLICGLENLDSGVIETYDPNIAMIFQYSALFDSLTVFDNIAFALIESPMYKNKYSKDQIHDLVAEKLKLVGLSGIEDKYPSELSGGMQKRVSFARGIITNPKIILYDEPTAGLDPVASTVIEDYIQVLKEDLNSANIIVTHQLSTINRTADRIIMLYEGRIVWSGTPNELQYSDDLFARQFISADRKGPMLTAAG